MGIRSHAFGRVTLTGRDATKFINQVRFGKPKSAAKESVRKGVRLAREFERDGKLSLTVRLKGT